MTENLAEERKKITAERENLQKLSKEELKKWEKQKN